MVWPTVDSGGVWRLAGVWGQAVDRVDAFFISCVL
jgi:hypothetical protein